MTNKKEKSDCKGYYEVSGYTTDDGKKIDSYTRRCWKHGGSGAGSSVQNTQDNIEKTNEELDKINNKEEITDEDLDLSKGYLSATISKVCEDCENYLEESENKVEIPTFESIEKSKDLKDTKNKILDNIEKSMTTIDKIEKIQKKQWDSVNMTDTDYNSKLYNYAKSKEIIDNINKNLRYLHEAVSNSWGIAKNYINELKTSNNEITEQGIPTGYAANIKSSPVNVIKNYIDHGGENGNPIWFLPEAYNSFDKRDGNWIEYLRLWPETNKRLEKFYERPDINITNKEKNIKNDMRHIVGPALFAQLYGSETTRFLSYLKESRDILLQRDLKDSIVDMKNNDLGIQIGLKYPNMSRDKLIELIYERYVKQKRNK